MVARVVFDEGRIFADSMYREAWFAGWDMSQRRVHTVKAMLNNSHLYHQTQHDLKRRGIDGSFSYLYYPIERSCVDLSSQSPA